MLRNFLDRGEWQRVLQGVYAVTAGPLTREMILNAAWLYGGPQAILSHDTAAEEWGMRRIDADKPVHVTVPYGKSVACSTPTALEWDAKFKEMADPSGRAVMDVHQQSY